MPTVADRRFAFLALWVAGFAVTGKAQEFDGRGAAAAPIRYGKVAALQMTSDQVTDVVFLHGSQPCFLYGPSLYDAERRFPRQALDFAVLPEASPKRLDAILFVGMHGAEFFWMEDGKDDFTRREVGLPGWRNCQLVAAASDSIDQGVIVVGVRRNRRTIRVLSMPSGVHATPLDLAGFRSKDTVRDIEILQFDGDEPLEVVAMTDVGLEVYDLDGTLLTVWGGFQPGDAMTVVRQDNQHSDRLAWITAVGRDQFLFTMDAGGDLEGPVALNRIDVIAATAGDQDEDGDDDLILSTRDGKRLWRVWNDRSPESPNASSFAAFPANAEPLKVPGSGVNGSSTDVPVAVSDADGDGDEDVLTPLEFAGQIHVLQGTITVADDQRPKILSLAMDRQPAVSTLQLELGQPTQLPSQANALQITVWQEESLGAGVVPVAVGNHVSPLSSWPLVKTITLPDFGAQELRVFYLEIRLAEVNASEELTQAFPAVLGGLAVHEPTILGLLALPGAGALIPVTTLETGGPEGIEGGFVPQAAIPMFLAPPQIPNPGV